MANKTNIIKVPGINGLGLTRGEELAPDLICSECEEIELNRDNIEEQEKQIYEYAKKLMETGKEKLIFIGGDHSISYPLTKAYFERNKGKKLIVFDAHYDLMESMENPTHEEWLNALIKTGLIEVENIMLVGIRRKSENIDSREVEYAEENKIKIIYTNEFEERKKEIMDFADKETYISFDIDAFDSSIVSATGYPEKNGLMKGEVFELFRKIKFRAFDIVEVNPTKKGKEETIKIAKEIVDIIT